jgi:hypothetical protein
MYSLSTPSNVLLHLLAKHTEQPARVQRVLEMWVSTYWCDFRDAPDLRAKLEQFCDERLGVEYDPDRRLRAWIDKMDRSDKGLKTSTQLLRVRNIRPPPPISQPASIGFLASALDLHPTEIARQLTLVDELLYKNIEPREATDQAWTKNNGVRAPNLLKLIERFNAVGDWVSSEILAADGRASAMIAHFVDVADQLRKLNNFQSTMAVLGGLGASAVTRLKEQWAEIGAPKRDLYDELSTLMSLTSNMKNLSDHLQTISPPAIPYVGLYLGHLTFIDEGNPNKHGELLNFGKRRQVTATVFQLCRFQILSYELADVPDLQQYVERYMRLPEADAYVVSLLILGRRAAELKVPRRWKAVPLAFEDGVARPRSFFADARQPPLALRDSSGRMQVATLVGFVASLTDPNSDDFSGGMSSAFLTFYRSLVSARVLLLLLRARYQTPPCKSAGERLDKYNTKVVQPLRQRVARVFNVWIGKFWHDIFEQPDAAAACRAVLAEMNEPYMERIVQQLQQMLDAKAQQYATLVAARSAAYAAGSVVGSVPTAEPATPSSSSAGSASMSATLNVGEARAEAALGATACAAALASGVESVARALSVLSWRTMQQVRVYELLTLFADAGLGAMQSTQQQLLAAWSDPAAAKRAPDTLKPLLEQHAATARWVSGAVLGAETATARCERIKFFADVAQRSRDLNDFASVSAIVSGLFGDACTPAALPHTWSLLESSDLERIDALALVVSSSNDWHAYRETARAAKAPGVPLVAVLVRDICDGCIAALSETAASLAEVDNKKAAAAPPQPPTSLANLLQGATVAPPARVEEHSIVHVVAWLRAAPAAVDFLAYQQTAYDAADFERHGETVRNVRLAHEAYVDAATLRARADAVRADEQAQRIVATPLERDLSTLLERVVADAAACKALTSAAVTMHDAIRSKQHDGIATQLERVEEKQGSMLAMVDKRMNAARSRLAELKTAWDEPAAVIELLTQTFPTASVALERLDDTAGAVYGWPQEFTLPVVQVSATAAAAAAAAAAAGSLVDALAEPAESTTSDGAEGIDPSGSEVVPARLVALCPRVASIAHVSAAKRLAPLVSAAPLIVTCECGDETRAIANDQGVRIVVV